MVKIRFLHIKKWAFLYLVELEKNARLSGVKSKVVLPRAGLSSQALFPHEAKLVAPRCHAKIAVLYSGMVVIILTLVFVFCIKRLSFSGLLLFGFNLLQTCLRESVRGLLRVSASFRLRVRVWSVSALKWTRPLVAEDGTAALNNYLLWRPLIICFRILAWIGSDDSMMELIFRFIFRQCLHERKH